MQNISSFTFQGWEIQEKENKILFNYSLQYDNNAYSFTDTLIVPGMEAIHGIPMPLVSSLLNTMLLVMGISYWKLYCPKDIRIASFSLSKEQADFWNTVYTKGLGEFFYENTIDFRGLVQFPFDPKKTLDLEPIRLAPLAQGKSDKSLLPVGGGKDSIVAAELLKKANKSFSVVAFSTGLNNSLAQQEVSEKIGVTTRVVKRLLDPQLFELNKREDTYNGHVPAVAIYSCISLFLAALWDYRYVVFANEDSASYGNVEYLGETVNHQWSKSLEFERLFQDYLAKFVTRDIQYFSLLRPFSEIKIAQLFSSFPQYFSSFVSCNRGYVMAKKGNTSWCGMCPKCAFVFLILAPFIPKETLINVFKKNLFEDTSLTPLYRQLLGLSDFKPFECVGTPQEVRLAAYLAWEKGEWKQSDFMKLFMQEVLPHMQNHEEAKKQLLSLNSLESIPEEFRKILDIMSF